MAAVSPYFKRSMVHVYINSGGFRAANILMDVSVSLHGSFVIVLGFSDFTFLTGAQLSSILDSTVDNSSLVRL